MAILKPMFKSAESLFRLTSKDFFTASGYGAARTQKAPPKTGLSLNSAKAGQQHLESLQVRWRIKFFKKGLKTQGVVLSQIEDNVQKEETCIFICLADSDGCFSTQLEPGEIT